MLTLFFGHCCEDCGANAAAPPFLGGPTACRISPTVGMGCRCLAEATNGAYRAARSNRSSGLPVEPVTGQFARKLGQRLVDWLAVVSQAFFDIFGNVA
jgi:hypothetical protein